MDSMETIAIGSASGAAGIVMGVVLVCLARRYRSRRLKFPEPPMAVYSRQASKLSKRAVYTDKDLTIRKSRSSDLEDNRSEMSRTSNHGVIVTSEYDVIRTSGHEAYIPVSKPRSYRSSKGASYSYINPVFRTTGTRGGMSTFGEPSLDYSFGTELEEVRVLSLGYARSHTPPVDYRAGDITSDDAFELEPTGLHGSTSGVAATPPPDYILANNVNTTTFAISQTPPVDYILNDISLEFHLTSS